MVCLNGTPPYLNQTSVLVRGIIKAIYCNSPSRSTGLNVIVMTT